MADAAAPTKEQTFRGYSAEQGQKYAQARPGYPAQLYEAIVDYHEGHGGRLDRLLDVGCGPGTVVRELGCRFGQAIGIDPSAGMISATQVASASARSDKADKSDEADRSDGSGPAVRFAVSTAEALGADQTPPLVADGSVDVITAATAAHWFDMAAFWARAAEVLKPGGTVALWSPGGGPLRLADDVPARAAVQALVDGIDDQVRDYMEPGNWVVRGLYADLALPWTVSPAVPLFDEASFVRQPWCTAPGFGFGPEYAVYPTPFHPVPLGLLERIVETSSPVTRWREAHPDLVGTDGDLVRRTFLQIERLMHEAGVEPGKEVVSGAYAGILLLVRKKG